MPYLAILLFNMLLLLHFQHSYAKEDDLALAKKAQNPLANMTVIPIRLNIYPNVRGDSGGYSTTAFPHTHAGPESSSSYDPYSSSFPPPPEHFRGTLNGYDINPTMPITIVKGQYLLLRWQQAIKFAVDVYQPHSTQNGLGDANPSIDYAYAFSDNLIIGAGGAFVIPTATNHFLGQGKWSAGPSITGVWSPGRWVVGVRAENVFSFAGPSGRPDINIMTIQPLVNYNLDDGWYLTSNPYWIANWNNSNRDKWTLPIGGGLGKLFTLGNQPMTFAAAVYWYPIKPTGGPEYSVRITLQYLFPQDDKKTKGS